MENTKYNQEIPVCFATDDNYIPFLAVAITSLLDNASKYKKADSKIEVDITSKAVTIRNQTGKEKFTPGTGIAIAGRILEQHKLQLRTVLKDGVFEAKFGKKLGKK